MEEEVFDDDLGDYYKKNKVVKLSQDDIIGICGVLSYDIALNQEALDSGFHPVSGIKKGKSNEHNIERNRKFIELLGGEEHSISKGIFEKEKMK